ADEIVHESTCNTGPAIRERTQAAVSAFWTSQALNRSGEGGPFEAARWRRKTTPAPSTRIAKTGDGSAPNVPPYRVTLESFITVFQGFGDLVSGGLGPGGVWGFANPAAPACAPSVC